MTVYNSDEANERGAAVLRIMLLSRHLRTWLPLINVVPAVMAISTLAFLLSLLATPVTASPADKSTDRPNVVLILADDQSYRDFGFMGNSLVHTPNLDRLASTSARYPNGYVPMSVCRPSLATLLTGRYPHQHGIHFNHPPPGLATMRTMTAEQYRQTRATTDFLIQNVPTLPRVLADHGYVCLQTGKHWEGSYHTAGFTHGMTLGQPADRLGDITGTRQQANGDWVAHGNGDAGLVIGRETMQPIDDFIAAHAGKRPFFVWYAPFLPHTPFDAPERFDQLYAHKQIPPHLLPYYSQIALFDETVGHLLQSLQLHQALKDTLIIFASDNGFRPDQNKPGRQDRRSKLSPFEDGLRTPILIRYDGHTVAAEHSELVQTVDLVPTILSAAGVSLAAMPQLSGIDLMPSATGQQPLPDRPAFGAIYPNDATVLCKPSQHVRAKWVRSGRFKLVVPGPAKPPVELALFDLSADPGEQTNLAAGPEYANIVSDLRTLLHDWWPDGDDSHVPENRQ